MRTNLVSLQEEVQHLLTKYPDTRGSDEKLYSRYLLRHQVSVVNVISFFMDFEKYGVSSFESVSRARRKIQETRADLRPSKEVLDARDELQGTFFDWARGVTAND